MSKFTHLHTHSHYSLLNALPKIDNILNKAEKCGATSIALTDDGVMYGVVDFYKKAIKKNIKPIIGVDFYVALRTRHDKQSRVDNKRYRLVLLAKNNQGYKNLMKLVSFSFIDGYYYKPRIDRELIKKYSEGLVAILPQFSSETSSHLKLNNIERAKESFNFYSKIFNDDLYFEIVHHPEMEEQVELQKSIIDFCNKNKSKLVATSDFYYLEKNQKKARDILTDIGAVRSGGNYHNDTDDFSYKTEKEMIENFSHIPKAISNTKEIEKKCNLKLELGKWTFPNLEKTDKNFNERLRELALHGLKEKKLDKKKEAIDRLNYELKVVKDKNFSVYFLIVADFIFEAKKRKILTNIRGSVAGSLITYVTGVTHLNPFEYKLPFERFLNPERPSAPDIDMDFASDGRDEILAYARKKYGEEKVAQIGTFGTMAARGSIKDATRAMGFDYKLGDKISKLIPMTSSLSTALESEKELQKIYNENLDAKKIINMAITIEGSARHISVHAAGVVIAPDKLTNYTPIQPDTKTGKMITQYDMYAIEDAGLIKFDFLGVTILSTIAGALKRIKKIHNIDIDIQKIPLNNKKTFKMLSTGFTKGCFQLSSEGMTKWLKELHPETIHDINAMVALYRPGAMSFIPEYIARKKNSLLIKYKDERMEKFLKDSLGLMIYQDDVMMIAIELAGYSWLEADKFRKAMGKKIPELMAEQEKKFKRGALEKGMDKNILNKLWEEITVFAQYGFNKAHSASYGRVAYQTAYLKANYPAEYMSSLLTSESGDNVKIYSFIQECKKMKLPVLPPDVNLSFKDFGVIKANNQNKRDQIRFGLRTIKNLGGGIAENIVEERKKKGIYKSLEDFLERNSEHKDLSKKSLEALSLSGALDSLENRDKILGNIQSLLNFIKECREQDSAQISLFGNTEINHLKLLDIKNKKIKIKTGQNEEIEYILPMSNQERLLWEKELLGIYLSSHPLEQWKEKLIKPGKNILSIKKMALIGNRLILGVVDELKIINTKKGEKMAFLKISDLTDSIEVAVFPKVFKEVYNILKLNKAYIFKGVIKKKDDDFNFLLEKLKFLE